MSPKIKQLFMPAGMLLLALGTVVMAAASWSQTDIQTIDPAKRFQGERTYQILFENDGLMSVDYNKMRAAK